MKKLEYKTPELEVITLEVEGIIAMSGEPSAFSRPTMEVYSNKTTITRSVTMNDADWR